VIVVVSVRGGFLSSAAVSVLAVLLFGLLLCGASFQFPFAKPNVNYIALLSFLTTSAVITHFVTRVRKSEGLAEQANVLNLTHDTFSCAT
jgi:K+-sensing histidine kinase KdpD